MWLVTSKVGLLGLRDHVRASRPCLSFIGALAQKDSAGGFDVVHGRIRAGREGPICMLSTPSSRHYTIRLYAIRYAANAHNLLKKYT